MRKKRSLHQTKTSNNKKKRGTNKHKTNLKHVLVNKKKTESNFGKYDFHANFFLLVPFTPLQAERCWINRANHIRILVCIQRLDYVQEIKEQVNECFDADRAFTRYCYIFSHFPLVFPVEMHIYHNKSVQINVNDAIYAYYHIQNVLKATDACMATGSVQA